jgi:hypothetical protein
MSEAVIEHVRQVVERLGHAELAALQDHGERLRGLVVHVHGAVWHKVRARAVTRYRTLEERYGRHMAIAILSAGILGCAVPLPGTTVLAMAPLLAMAELHHQLHTAHEHGGVAEAVKTHLAESEILHLARQWVHELAAASKEA